MGFTCQPELKDGRESYTVHQQQKEPRCCSTPRSRRPLVQLKPSSGPREQRCDGASCARKTGRTRGSFLPSFLASLSIFTTSTLNVTLRVGHNSYYPTPSTSSREEGRTERAWRSRERGGHRRTVFHRVRGAFLATSNVLAVPMAGPQ